MATTYSTNISNINLPNTYTVNNGTIGYTTSWANPSTHITGSTGKAVMTIKEQEVVLEEKATLDVKGNVKINGLDLEERLSTIEKVLQIPSRDVTMENKYPKLKKLYQEYMNELEKYRTFERLKGED